MNKKSLNQHYLDHQVATQSQMQPIVEHHQQPSDFHASNMDAEQLASSGRIVVINNNNTNINIHHQPTGAFQQQH